MWGVCLDSNAIQDGLFQTVIQYKRKENGEVVRPVISIGVMLILC